jgi:Mlc titration factor MtfA (ptsG expression regulator)
MIGLWRRWQRNRLGREPFPAAWEELLAGRVPLYGILPGPERTRLRHHVRILLDEKAFEGCGGLEVTDEMRVTVAGHASLLLLADPDDYYPMLGTVILYPESFAAPVQATDQVGVVTETVEERLGESWQEGTVVLAWDNIEEIIRGTSGDCNVIIHEFAHQIDAQRGICSGAPLRAPGSRCRDWGELLELEQRQQRTARRRGRPAVLDPYAFTSPEELFAVASETFFMRPVRLKTNHPGLYAELEAVYGLDPAGWLLTAGCIIE